MVLSRLPVREEKKKSLFYPTRPDTASQCGLYGTGLGTRIWRRALATDETREAVENTFTTRFHEINVDRLQDKRKQVCLREAMQSIL